MASDSVLKSWRQFGETSNSEELAGLATISAPAASFLEDIQASSCRYAGKEALLDDRVDAPITIDHLRDTEINPDGHERNRLVLGEPLGGHQEAPHLAERIPQREIDRGF
jgi:hypothetical protein